MNLGKKYGAGMLIAILLFLVSTVVAGAGLKYVEHDVKEVTSSSQRSIDTIEMAKIFQQQGFSISNYIIDKNPKHRTRVTELAARFKVLETKIQPILTTKEQKTRFSEIVQKEQELVKLFEEEIVPAVTAHDERTYKTAKFRGDKIIEDNIQTLESFNEVLSQERKSIAERAVTIIQSTFLLLVIALIVSSIVGGGLLFFVTRTVNKHLNHVISTANSIASGNLGVEIPDYKGNDEIKQLSQSVDAMRQNLQGMIQEISSVSYQVTEKSEELMQSSNEVKTASEQIALTMDELSSGANEQANTSSTIAIMMDSYVEKVNAANKESKGVQTVSADVLELTKTGNKLMHESTEKMTVIQQLVHSSVKRVKGLDAEVKQISHLVKVISDIADQTNLLALNAAIEAARAGEHGRGFAVVADEVRKLAEQVSRSVSDITSIVQGIQAESHEVVTSLEEGYGQVEEGAQKVVNTQHTFSHIHEAITSMNGNIHAMTTNLQDIATYTNEMNNSIEGIASVSEESAAGIEQTSASIQQTNGAMSDISANSAYLAQLSDQLKKMIATFRV